MKLIPIAFCLGFVLVHLLGCAADVAPSTGLAEPTRHDQSFCDINCQTGGLDGWYNVPASCDQLAAANPSAPDWYLDCAGVTYTPYEKGAYSCQIPENVCTAP